MRVSKVSRAKARGAPDADTHRHRGLAAARHRPYGADRLRRYREYLDYHEGRRGASPIRARERSLTFNYARAIVEKGVSYLVIDHHPAVTPGDATAEERTQATEATRLLVETWS